MKMRKKNYFNRNNEMPLKIISIKKNAKENYFNRKMNCIKNEMHKKRNRKEKKKIS